MIAKDKGFILKRYNFRESSVIATLYTLNFGKINGILKGFYTFKKEFSTSLDIFTLNEIIFYPKKSQIWLISSAELVEDYPFLRKEYFKAKIAAIFLNLIDKAILAGEKSPYLFFLLKQSLNALEKEEERKILYIFLIKFLTISGFKPYFYNCRLCQSPLKKKVFFTLSGGGLVCESCSPKIDNPQRITPQVRAAILYIQQSNFSEALRLNTSPNCTHQILFFLKQFFLYHLDFELKW